MALNRVHASDNSRAAHNCNTDIRTPGTHINPCNPQSRFRSTSLLAVNHIYLAPNTNKILSEEMLPNCDPLIHFSPYPGPELWSGSFASLLCLPKKWKIVISVWLTRLSWWH